MEQFEELRGLTESLKRKFSRYHNPLLDDDDIQQVCYLAYTETVAKYVEGCGRAFASLYYLLASYRIQDVIRDTQQLRKRKAGTLLISLDDDTQYINIHTYDSYERIDAKLQPHIFNNLSAQEKTVLREHYWRNRTLKSIGIDMNVSEARACQIKGFALKKLRRVLNGRDA